MQAKKPPLSFQWLILNFRFLLEREIFERGADERSAGIYL